MVSLPDPPSIQFEDREDLLLNADIWVDKWGKRAHISELSDAHLENIIRKLEQLSDNQILEEALSGEWILISQWDEMLGVLKQEREWRQGANV